MINNSPDILLMYQTVAVTVASQSTHEKYERSNNSFYRKSLTNIHHQRWHLL